MHTNMKVNMKTDLKVILTICVVLVATSITSNAQTFIYDGVGRVSIVRYDGGLETRYAYDKNGNITSIRTQVINSVAENTENDKPLTVLPNPSSDNVVVVLGELVSGIDVTVYVRDLAGRTLVERTTRTEGDRLSLDVQDLASGTYVIECRYGSVTRTSSLHVVR